MADVVLKGIRKSFGEIETIHGVDLEIKDREFVVFVGPSGCGKSTLLRLIAGLEDITAGEMMIDGQVVNDLPPSKRGIAMVFQSYALYPHMTVYENMAFGLKLAKESKETIDAQVRKAADILQITDLLDRLPKEMSGGQRQRVAIGRAIVRNPKVFLFDEPLSNLDAALRVATRIEIAKLHENLKGTVVYVTHDQVEAMTLAHKIVVLRDGYVEQVGPPMHLYHHPDNLFVAGFIGSPTMNFLQAEVASTDPTSITVKMPGGESAKALCDPGNAKPGDKATFGVRPEHLLPNGGGESQLTGTISLVEHLGEDSIVYIELPHGEQIVCKDDGETLKKAGDTITIGVPQAESHVFDAEGRAFKRAKMPAEAAE